MIFEKNKGGSRRTRDAMILIIVLLVAANGVQAYYNVKGAQRNTRMTQVIIVQGRQEVASALETVQQLSRIGGSYTYTQLGTLRQHLYAIKQLNTLTASLYGVNRGIADNAKVEKALEYVAACEARLLAGQAIDVELSELRALLDRVSAEISQLQ